jgi:indoleamine 2,3-dioxygenase
VSPITGFLPESPPLERLPDPYYDPWEDTVLDLPQLIASDALKDKLDSLPTLSTTKLDTEEEWRRAYVVLSFLSQGYIWSGNKPRRVSNACERCVAATSTNPGGKELPISIVAPLRKVSEYLAINPCGTFAAYCLWNIASNPTFGNERSNPDDFVSLCTFTGSKEEEWFYVISVAIEAQGGRLISQMLDAIDAVHENDASRVQSFLEAFITCVDGISATLSRLNENLSQGFFYHRLRPFLRGSRNMARTGLPDGIYYPRCQCQGGEGEWLAYSGGSNAQSSLIQLMDIILGIDHDVEFIKVSLGN